MPKLPGSDSSVDLLEFGSDSDIGHISFTTQSDKAIQVDPPLGLEDYDPGQPEIDDFGVFAQTIEEQKGERSVEETNE